MRVSIFGTGHVGLVTAVCFADLGHTIVAVDKNPEVVGRLAQGEPTVYEPGLEDLLRANLDAGRLRFTTSAEDGVRSSETIFLCVGTPTYPDGRADLSQVDDAVQSIVPHVDAYRLIVEKSTVPVDTAACIDRAIRLLAGRSADVEVASNPEFLREGSAVRDFLRPDRIVIGADSDRARARLLQLYERGFDCPVLVTSVKMAELIKHAANAFLATKISFVNMLADLCDKVGGDVSVLARGIGLDRRIGPQFLEAGLGFGGSCFRKDLHAFVRIADESGVDFSLLRQVDRINEARVDRLLAKLDRALWVVRDKRVAVLGLSFKDDTDDIREAPSLRLVPRLLERGASLRLYDPRAMGRFASLHPAADRLAYAASGYEALQDAHAAVILTGWDEFRTLDWERARGLMRTPVVVDGRNLFAPEEMRARGLEYYSLGRGDVPVALGAR